MALSVQRRTPRSLTSTYQRVGAAHRWGANSSRHRSGRRRIRVDGAANLPMSQEARGGAKVAPTASLPSRWWTTATWPLGLRGGRLSSTPMTSIMPAIHTGDPRRVRWQNFRCERGANVEPGTCPFPIPLFRQAKAVLLTAAAIDRPANFGDHSVFSPALANAKPYDHHHGYHRHYGYGYGGARWCRSDPSPRHLLYFKRADNRCTGTIRIGIGRYKLSRIPNALTEI
jgi:hypothetical protein